LARQHVCELVDPFALGDCFISLFVSLSLKEVIYELNNLYFVLASDGESNIYTYINIYIYIHTHTYTHTYTHIYSLFSRTSLPL